MIATLLALLPGARRGPCAARSRAARRPRRSAPAGPELGQRHRESRVAQGELRIGLDHPAERDAAGARVAGREEPEAPQGGVGGRAALGHRAGIGHLRQPAGAR